MRGRRSGARAWSPAPGRYGGHGRRWATCAHTVFGVGTPVGDELMSDNVCGGHAVSPSPPAQRVHLTWCCLHSCVCDFLVSPDSLPPGAKKNPGHLLPPPTDSCAKGKGQGPWALSGLCLSHPFLREGLLGGASKSSTTTHHAARALIGSPQGLKIGPS